MRPAPRRQLLVTGGVATAFAVGGLALLTRTAGLERIVGALLIVFAITAVPLAWASGRASRRPTDDEDRGRGP